MLNSFDSVCCLIKFDGCNCYCPSAAPLFLRPCSYGQLLLILTKNWKKIKRECCRKFFFKCSKVKYLPLTLCSAKPLSYHTYVYTVTTFRFFSGMTPRCWGCSVWKCRFGGGAAEKTWEILVKSPNGVCALHQCRFCKDEKKKSWVTFLIKMLARCHVLFIILCTSLFSPHFIYNLNFLRFVVWLQFPITKVVSISKYFVRVKEIRLHLVMSNLVCSIFAHALSRVMRRHARSAGNGKFF